MATIRVNGVDHVLDGTTSDMKLLWYLRDVLGLTGTKYGCGVEACGACSVLLGGEVVRSCDTDVTEAIGREVTTVEGLAATPVGRKLQDAWVSSQVPQCGYCQSGMLIAATALVRRNPNPSDSAIDGAMRNICACGTYPRIRAAIHAAAKA